MYVVKEIFDTVQGEGLRAGARSVFVRFAGCNLWNGRPDDRSKGTGACARWCDTDFVGGEKLDVAALLARMDAQWKPPESEDDERWCVLTGGEPMLQVDWPLVDALITAGWRIAVETNGTLDPDDGKLLDVIDHLTVSPKVGGDLVRKCGTELKVVLPGAAGSNGWSDADLDELARDGTWDALYVQPQDPILSTRVGASFLHGSLLGARDEYRANVERCLRWVRARPAWRLSLQLHKTIGIP